MGIMVQPLEDISRLNVFAETAQKVGFELVSLFHPSAIHFRRREIDAYVFKDGRWLKQRIPFPSIIYDIGIYANHQDSVRANLLQKSNIPFVGYTLGNKDIIDRHLRKSLFLKAYLIPTYKLRKVDDIFKYLSSYRAIILKPLHGWGGRDIFKIEKKVGGIVFYENQREKLVPNRSLAVQMVKQLVGKERYIIQPWLDIRSKEDFIADHRVLIQKNEEGNWKVRMIGTRLGQHKNITSNIKSGAEAIETLAYLTKEFGQNKGKQLKQKLSELAYTIATYLEKSYCKRLVELGIDFAIDRRATIKIIEVNVKPGRQIIETLADQQVKLEVLEAPFYYARRLLNRS